MQILLQTIFSFHVDSSKLLTKSITEEVFIDPMVIHRFALLVTNAICFLLNSKSLSLKLPEL